LDLETVLAFGDLPCLGDRALSFHLPMNELSFVSFFSTGEDGESEAKSRLSSLAGFYRIP